MTVVDEIKKDRESGAKRLEREYKTGLMAFAKRFCNDESEAEALVYRTFSEVIAGIDGYTEQSAFFGWMCKILVNCHANDIRRRSNQTVVNVGTLPEIEDDGASRVVEAIDAKILREAVENLPPEMKEAVLLRYFMDLPIVKVAQILAKPIGTVKSRLYYARVMLAQRLGAKIKKPAVALIAAGLFMLAATAAVVVGGGLVGRGGDAAPDAVGGDEPTAWEGTQATEVTEATPADRSADSPAAASVSIVPSVSSIPSTPSSDTQLENRQGERKMKTTAKGKMLGIAAAVAMANAASGAPNVAINSVTQRWPWNNKVDITYTVGNGQDVSQNLFRRLVFTATVNGSTYTIDGVSDVGASANTGTHTVTWTAPSGIKATDCRMSAALYNATAPSGDDYMVIDLDTGAVAYEGLLASQGVSNARYNTAIYKTDKLVLRKVAAGGVYPTGDGSSGRTATTWKTDRDYYIGIFMVTQAQYEKITGQNPSNYKAPSFPDFEKDGLSNIAAHRPVECVKWTLLRGSSATPSTVLTANANGTFLERLMAKTGLDGFDLPTEIMWEIAARAGVTTRYFWNTNQYPPSDIGQYVTYGGNSEDSLGRKQTWSVGSRLPNNWGLYDVSGNDWEICRDGNSLADMANAPDPWTPAPFGSLSDGQVVSRAKGGHTFNFAADNGCYWVSYRMELPIDAIANNRGFRIARIVP